MTFGSRLRGERKAKGLTMGQLALCCGIRGNAQGLYEHGTRFPRADYLMCLGNHGFDLQFLLMGARTAVDPNQLSGDEQKILQFVQLLSNEDRRALLRILGTMAGDKVANVDEPV